MMFTLITGLNDKGESGRWQYTNGDSVTLVNWKNGRPRVRRSGQKKKCVVVKKESKWRDKDCDKFLARYICEAHPSAELTSTNTKQDLPRKQIRRQRVSQRSHLADDDFAFLSYS